ncbi:uncharacterized protein LOC133308372 [Gastrolobium bilobum]|uniref:uncharacterized protein LOC133308372 n=1 Tax=Gastrolobium bilobum TaxID=150636 RepID=UPI002AB0CCD2|nr:uncharacterized protein LOC133308372 [Gastrolobium bilobum]
MLKCLNSDEAKYVLAKIHEGINGHHMGGKDLPRKALRAGYFWPTMEAYSKDHVKKCDSCQKHAKLILSPPDELNFQARRPRLKKAAADPSATHANGQAEAVNKVIVNGLKKRMFDAEESWVHQLYFFLWGYRTITQTTTGETPFRLTYGYEAMILEEIEEPSWRQMKSSE